MTKRRFIEFLPEWQRTPLLTEFFGATVDQVFQPGSFDQISGYIGRHPSYSDPAVDFYIAEPDAERAAYQLEPGMVSYDPAGTLLAALSYRDLVAYLASLGANTTDHQRLFDCDRYCWAPPVDLDKLVNFERYYWFGGNAAEIPTVALTSPTLTYTGNASQTSYLLPPPLAQISADRETPCAYVDGVLVPSTLAGDAIVLAAPPPSGARVLVSRCNDLAAAIIGQSGFVLTDLTTPPPAALSNGMRVRLLDPLHLFGGWDAAPWDDTPWDSGRDSGFFWVDGVGSAITLLSDAVFATGINPQYVTISRASTDGNPWSRHNAWVHESAFAWSGESFPSLQARRPIVEFLPNLVIYGYGTIRLDPVDLIATSDTALSTTAAGWDEAAYDSSAWDRPLHLPATVASIVGQPVGSLSVPGPHGPLPLVPGTTLLLARTAITGETLDNTLYLIGADSANTYTMTPLAVQPSSGAIVLVLSTGAEYAFDGAYWHRPVLAPGASDPYSWVPNTDPLFQLYDVFGHRLDDSAHFPGSDFAGNRLFGYAAGSGPLDPVLGRAIEWDGNLQPIFENDVVTRPMTADGGSFVGIGFYGIADGVSVTIDCAWHRTASSGPQVAVDGVFPIPANLQANPNSIDVRTLSKSNWSPHFTQIIAGQTGLVGSPGGLNNRCNLTHDYSLGSEILEHCAPLLKTMLLAADPSFDYLAAVRYVGQEYSRFRRKFMRQLSEYANRGGLSPSASSDAWVDAVLASLVVGKGNDFPFAYSPMAGGGNFIPPTPAALGLLPCATPPITVSSARILSGSVVRVADTSGLSVGLLAVGPGIAAGTTITAITGQSLTLSQPVTGVLASGAALYFLVPDPQGGTPALRGHDGSLTPAFGDWRDAVLLTLERRIYNAIPAASPAPLVTSAATLSGVVLAASASTVALGSAVSGPGIAPGCTITAVGRQSVTLSLPITAPIAAGTVLSVQAATAAVDFKGESRPLFDLAHWIGGRFCEPVTNGYRRAEIMPMLAGMFELWSAQNQLTARANTGFDATDPFTWNYRGVADRFGDALPGSWRAIYRWYYDSIQPHLCPWEMLGFTDPPPWWQASYGPAPYSRSHPTLWADLEAGRIAAGPREGIDPRYARPGLSRVIPVDVAGRLLDPVAAGIVVRAPVLQQAARDWQAGDEGPVESLWINNPAYRFALAQLAFLLKPARFIEQGWDRLNAGFINGQWLDARSLQRPRTAGVFVHGETQADGSVAVATGLQQWMSDWLLADGRPASVLGTAVRGLDASLMYQMAGFTNRDTLKVVADNVGLLPAENVQVALYESPARSTEVYSGVTCEWTGQGWRVGGYDAQYPFFSVIPPDPNSTRSVISLATSPEPVIHPWRPNTYYAINSYVGYRNSVYRCARSHTSGPQFEASFWTATPEVSLQQAPRVLRYSAGLPQAVTVVPYGTVFDSLQAVADFLLGWERWLVARGWVFDDVDPQTQTVRDWSNAVHDFLNWTQVQWQPGNFIALSPAAVVAHFNTPTGIVLNVEDSQNGFFGLLDRSGQPINQRSVTVNRYDADVTLRSDAADIFCVRLRVAEIEHVLLFDDRTIFNDAVYLPVFNQRQTRLRLICDRASGWAGRMDAPGFLIADDQLLPSFDKATDQVRLMFGIEDADRKVLRDYARHTIGYQDRDYLDNLLLSDTTQFEFYQGMTQAKGSLAGMSALMRSQRITGPGASVALLEEWAIRQSQFGPPRNPRVTFQLGQSETRRDPQFVRFNITANAPPDWIELPGDDPGWIDPPAANGQFFPTRDASLKLAVPTAGPVRLTEVNHAVASTDDLAALYTYARNAGLTRTTPLAPALPTLT